MMKVRILSSIAGINYSYKLNDTPELSNDEAARLIKAGIAEKVIAKKPVKKAK